MKLIASDIHAGNKEFRFTIETNSPAERSALREFAAQRDYALDSLDNQDSKVVVALIGKFHKESKAYSERNLLLKLINNVERERLAESWRPMELLPRNPMPKW